MTKRQTVGTVMLCVGFFAGCYAPAQTQPCENGTLCENGQTCVEGVCGGVLLDAPRADGCDFGCASFNGGGGGGSAGKIVIRGGQRDLSMATLSPAATQLPAMTQ